MELNNLYVAAALIVIIGFFIIYRYGSYKEFMNKRDDVPVDNESDLLVTENAALEKKVDALESTIREKDVLIGEILNQKRSYETMDRYIEQLENTIQNLQQSEDTKETNTNE